MGLFDFLRRKDKTAMPDPGSPEFQRALEGSALPGSSEMGEPGWASVGDATSVEELRQRVAGQFGVDPGQVEVEGETRRETIDLRGSDARERVLEALREHGIDPDRKGQEVDASTVPGLQEAIMRILGEAGVDLPEAGVQIPEAGGVGGWVGTSGDAADPRAQLEHLAAQRDAGRITQAEFEAQKRRLLGP